MTQETVTKPAGHIQGGLTLPGFKDLSNQTPSRSLGGQHQYACSRLSSTEIKTRWQTLQQHPRDEWMQTLKNAAIIGFGGAGFPAAQKILAASEANTLILNAMECEPYITCDDRLIREHANEILLGAAIICQLLPNIEQVLIGIEDNKPEAFSALTAAQSSWLFRAHTTQQHDQQKHDRQKRNIPLSIVSCPTKYPSGGEKQLIQLLLQQEVPLGLHPTDVGVLCQNVGTCYAIYERLFLDRQPTHRLTTLTGQAIPENVRGNYWLPLGMSLETLFSTLNVELSSHQTLMIGGPIMGKPTDSLSQHISQTTQCILVPCAEELPKPKPAEPCIRCGECAEVCPVQLLPQELHRHLKSDQLTSAKTLHLDACIECRACDLVCPSHIPLANTFHTGKQHVILKEQADEKALRAKARFETREQRLKTPNRIKRTASVQESAPREHTPLLKTSDSQHTSNTQRASKTTLKNQLKQAQKKWQDAEKALNTARKLGKDVSHIEHKVAILKNNVDTAKRALDHFKQQGSHLCS